jgi:hypothetical protein
MEHFAYESHQLHSVSVNGKTIQRENKVAINNGKGKKSVIVTENGKTRKSEKSLNKSELRCIRKHKYIPGLFKDCLKGVNARLIKSNTRKSHSKKTRRNK